MPVWKSRTAFSFSTGYTSDAGCFPGSAFTRRVSEKSSVTKMRTEVPDLKAP